MAKKQENNIIEEHLHSWWSLSISFFTQVPLSHLHCLCIHSAKFSNVNQKLIVSQVHRSGVTQFACSWSQQVTTNQTLNDELKVCAEKYMNYHLQFSHECWFRWVRWQWKSSDCAVHGPVRLQFESHPSTGQCWGQCLRCPTAVPLVESCFGDGYDDGFCGDALTAEMTWNCCSPLVGFEGDHQALEQWEKAAPRSVKHCWTWWCQ